MMEGVNEVIGLDNLQVGDTIAVVANGITARIEVIADDAEMLAGRLQMRVSEAKQGDNGLPPGVKWFIEKSGQVTVTFVAKPIETAPKTGEPLMLFDRRSGFWKPGEFSYGDWFSLEDEWTGLKPTHWCYPHEMEVPNA